MKKNEKNIIFFLYRWRIGHAVRQRAIIKEFLNNKKVESITVYTSKTLKILKEEFSNKINYRDVFNNIKTKKNTMGHLKIKETNKMFEDWEINSKLWLKKRLKENIKADFIISDFVLSFWISKNFKIKSYGCHFTWDWLYKKILKKKKINGKIIKQVDKIFFPPITDNEILKNIKKIT